MNRLFMVQWSTRPLSRDKRLPPGFIETCQPVLYETVPSGPDWFHEIKHDGWRFIARKSGKRVNLWSRNAYDWANTFPSIVKAVRHLPYDHLVLDGEAVAHDENGLPDFWALQGDGARSAVLYAFDVLVLGDDDLREHPLSFRRDLLDEVVADPIDGLQLSEIYEGNGAELFRHACSHNLEGIVSKLRHSPYRSGRCDAWRKIKCAEYKRRE